MSESGKKNRASAAFNIASPRATHGAPMLRNGSLRLCILRSALVRFPTAELLPGSAHVPRLLLPRGLRIRSYSPLGDIPVPTMLRRGNMVTDAPAAVRV